MIPSLFRINAVRIFIGSNFAVTGNMLNLLHVLTN